MGLGIGRHRRNLASARVMLGAASASTPAPDAPVLTLDNYTGSTITVSWPSVSGATSYKVYKDGVLVSAAATSPYTFTGLSANTSYALTAKAVNAGGDSAASNTITQRTAIFYDTFTDTNGTALASHTPETGGPWVADAGSWEIQSNRCVTTDTAAGQNEATVSMGVADVQITATILTGATADGRIVGNFTDVSNFWIGYFAGTSTIIYERASGSFISRASSTISSPVSETLTAVLTCKGANITWLIKGVSINYNNASRAGKTATKHGVGNYDRSTGSGGTAARFDTLIVENAP